MPLLSLTALTTSLPKENSLLEPFEILLAKKAKIPVRIGFNPPIKLSITATLEPPLPALVIAK